MGASALTKKFIATEVMKKELKRNAKSMISNRINGQGGFSSLAKKDVLWTMHKKDFSQSDVIAMLGSSQRIIGFFAEEDVQGMLDRDGRVLPGVF